MEVRVSAGAWMQLSGLVWALSGKHCVSDSEEKNAGILTDPVDDITCEACSQEIDVSECEAFSDVECPVCGCIQSVPAQLGHYRLNRLLGTGGMGGVYLADDQTLNRQVAIKVMLQSLGDDTDFVRTFQKEAQAAAALNHPNVAQIYTFGQEKGQPYIVMELVSGKQFKRMVDEEQPLHQGMVMQIGVDIAESLRAATELGLLHGDVKPENILLDEKGNAKLVDFGLASMADSGEGGVWGTPYYIAPEKVTGKKPDERSDLYSLGATLYHALAGRPPFEGDTPIDVVKARLKGPPPRLSRVRKDVDDRVERVIDRMLEKEPGRRYPNYGSLISDMRRVTEAIGGRRAIGSKASSGRIVFTKKRAAPVAVSASTAPKTTTRAKAVRRGRSEDSEEREKKPKKKKSGPPVALFVVLGILLIGGGLGGVIYHFDQKSKKEKAAYEAKLVQDAKAAAKADFEKISTGAKAMLEKLSGLDGAGDALEAIRQRSPVTTALVHEANQMLEQLTKRDRVVADNFLAQASQVRLQAEQASSSSQAGMNAKQMAQIAGAMEEKFPEIEARLAKLKEKAAEVEAKDQEFQEAEKRRKEEEAKRKKDEAARKAEEDRRKAEEAKAAQAAQEMDKARALVDSTGQTVSNNDWHKTLADLTAAQKSYKNPQAKALLQPAIGRYQELAGLKDIFIQQIGAKAPVRGVLKKNIVSATKTEIVLEGDEKMAWSDLAVGDILGLARFALSNLRGAPGRQSADLFFKQAVYFYENNQRGDNMKKLIARASGFDASYTTRAAAIMPDGAE